MEPMQALELSDYLIGLFIVAVIFLVFRWVGLWYWKINKMVELLEQIRDNTEKEDKPEESATNALQEDIEPEVKVL
ncbi:MAG: hypothetical protein GX846_06255 [Deltaproteobacteria bacterium]|nr:hypothetical protein [Deltaproteobacteria bacterium]